MKDAATSFFNILTYFLETVAHASVCIYNLA